MTATRRLLLSLAASALALAGCNAPQESAQLDPAPVALGQLAPAASTTTTQDVFPLGAGDALGREIFTYYVACLQAHDHYATGRSAFPEER